MDKERDQITVATGAYSVLKRAADIILSAAPIIILSPVMAVIGMLVAVSSDGGAIFRQERLGRNEKKFECLKFRTMYRDAPHDIPTAEFAGMEKHITPIGKVLRKTSIDELPQLFNVLRGDMSMVGPRPLIANEREMTRMRREAGIYRVRPGITGFAQINGRDNVKDDEKIALDKAYMEEMSFFTDVTILVMALSGVVRGKDIATAKGKEK